MPSAAAWNEASLSRMIEVCRTIRSIRINVDELSERRRAALVADRAGNTCRQALFLEQDATQLVSSGDSFWNLGGGRAFAIGVHPSDRGGGRSLKTLHIGRNLSWDGMSRDIGADYAVNLLRHAGFLPELLRRAS